MKRDIRNKKKTTDYTKFVDKKFFNKLPREGKNAFDDKDPPDAETIDVLQMSIVFESDNPEPHCEDFVGGLKLSYMLRLESANFEMGPVTGFAARIVVEEQDIGEVLLYIANFVLSTNNVQLKSMDLTPGVAVTSDDNDDYI